MFKICSCILIMYISITLGRYYIEKEIQRIRLLKEIKKMVTLLKGVIRYGIESMLEAMKSISNKIDIELKDFLEYVVDEADKMNGISLKDIWKRGIEEKLNKVYFTKEDRETLSKVGGVLGYLDKELQIENIKQYMEEIDTVIKELEFELDKKKKLYRTLSITGGLFVIILFIN